MIHKKALSRRFPRENRQTSPFQQTFQNPVERAEFLFYMPDGALAYGRLEFRNESLETGSGDSPGAMGKPRPAESIALPA
jgi:hypothetical protein